MKRVLGTAIVLFAGATANALPVLQFDVNQFAIQSQVGGGNAPFGGLTHTGSVVFSASTSMVLNGVSVRSVPNGSFINQNFNGVLTNFSGQVNLNGGQVTGGNFTITVLTAGFNDTYTCVIVPGSGAVATYVGGGFKIEALTNQGAFSDAAFGNVNVNPWFSTQGFPGGLPGSFLEFNFNPDALGGGTSDMDAFVDVAPLPAAAWAGLGTLAGLVAVRRLRRR